MNLVEEKKPEMKKQEEIEKSEKSPTNESSCDSGRIFDAENEPNEVEKKDVEQFRALTKKYNDLSREILKQAIEKEKNELNSAKISPKVKYYEGTAAQRINELKETAEMIEKRHKTAAEKSKQLSQA